MPITTMDQFLASMGSGQDQNLFFANVATATTSWINLNSAADNSFGKWNATTTAAFSSGGTTFTQNNFTSGIPLWTPATAGSNTYIGRLSSSFSISGTIHVYDLLWGASGFACNTTSQQNVSSFTGLPSRSTGNNAEIWISPLSPAGASSTTVVVGFKDTTGGGPFTCSAGMGASLPTSRMVQATGGTSTTFGVNEITSVTLTSSTGSAGNLGVFLLRRICSIYAPLTSVMNIQDGFSLCMPLISDSACLLFVHQATTTSTGVIMGQLTLVQG
jgi:hypothetical protein